MIQRFIAKGKKESTYLVIDHVNHVYSYDMCYRFTYGEDESPIQVDLLSIAWIKDDVVNAGYQEVYRI